MSRNTVIIAGVLIVAVAAALGFFWPFRNGHKTLRLAGIVEIQEVRLGSKVGGRVAQVFVMEGDVVEAKKKLVEFEVPELEAQRAQLLAKLAAAKAEFDKAYAGPRQQEKDAAKAAFDAAEARYARMKAGWREEEKQQASSELDATEAVLKQAVDDYQRIADLYRRNSASRAEYDAAVGQRDQARGRFFAAKARYDMMKAGNRPEDIAMAQAESAQAKANHDLLKAGTRAEDMDAAEARLNEMKARMAELETNLNERFVTAPEKAVVEVLAVRKGDLVPPNQPVVRVLRAEDLWVKVYVPETELGKIRLNQEVEVRIDSYPDTRFKGVIRQIATISEFTPRNVQSVDERHNQVFGVKVYIQNPQGIFRAGMAAEVTVPLHSP